MSLCYHANEKINSTEIDRLKSSGSSSSASVGEEATTSSNNSGSVADRQHPLVSCRDSGSNPEVRSTAHNVSAEVGSPEKVPKKYLDERNEFLQWVDAKPASPPSYKLVNPNKRIRFPIYESSSSSSEKPPKYSPAVDEVTVVSMKQEWLTPYEASPTRNWRNCFMEINSTQLNFYRIDESLTSGIRHYSNGESKESHHSHFLSLPIKNAYQFNKADQERICFNLKRNRKKYLTTDRIIKTYSLQCAKLGIPTDYTKRTFVLRMRCESEQFLLNFAHVDDMIMWTMHLQTGIGVSLDLNFREYPSYRVVPRRRRRRRARNRENSLFSTGLGAHKRSNSTSLIQMNSPASSSAANTQSCWTARDSATQRSTRSTKSSASGFLSISGWSQKPNTLSKSSKKTASEPSSRRSSLTDSTASSNSFKLKLKGLFRTKTDDRVNSPTKAAVGKLQRQHEALNCVLEDDEEEESVLRTKSLPGRENVSLDSQVEEKFLPEVEKAVTMKPPSRIELPPSNLNSIALPQHNSVSLPSTPCGDCLLPEITHPELRNAHANHRELEEFREVVREHNEAEDGETFLENPLECDVTGEGIEREDEDDEEEEDEDAEDEDEEGFPNFGGDHSRSIYVDEGIFHDSDDDYVYTMESRINYRNRASSTTSALSHTPYGSSEVKWSPPIKEMSRRRYIRDSLRCIKPLSEGHRWIGKVVCRPSRAPPFETINVPITFGSYSHELQRRKSTNSTSSWENIDYKQTINHFLKVFVVGPTGFVKAGSKMFDSWLDVQ